MLAQLQPVASASCRLQIIGKWNLRLKERHLVCVRRVYRIRLHPGNCYHVNRWYGKVRWAESLGNKVYSYNINESRAQKSTSDI